MKINQLQSKKVFRDLGVTLVILFGSHATKTAHPKSDVDIGVVFKNPTIITKKPVLVYGGLFEEFKKKFPKNTLDIVYLQDAPLSLQYQAVTHGKPLYESSRTAYADYKEFILLRYFDFKYFESIFKEGLTIDRHDKIRTA